MHAQEGEFNGGSARIRSAGRPSRWLRRGRSAVDSRHPRPAKHHFPSARGTLRARHSLNILGISAFYHDSAACLVRDGEIVAAAQEERFTRKKHDYRFPTRAIEYCLAEGGISAA